MTLMANSTINLRDWAEKKTENSSSLEKLDSAEVTTSDKKDAGPEAARDALLYWTAKETGNREFGSRLFFVLGGLALIFVIFGVFTENYFFSIFIALAAAILMFYIKRGPQEVRVVITLGGVQVGRSFLEFKDIKSFWIFEKQDLPELSLETQRILTPFLRVPLNGVEIEDLKKILLSFLKEEEHKESTSDQIARSLGL